jgi:hypothetical protein
VRAFPLLTPLPSVPNGTARTAYRERSCAAVSCPSNQAPAAPIITVL